MAKYVFKVLILVLLAAGFAVAQAENDRERQDREDREKAAIALAQQATTPRFESFINSLLPANDGAWTVSISRSGGFRGSPAHLITAITSDGIFTCGSRNDSYETDYLDLSLTADIESFIGGSNLKALRKAFKTTGSFCSDCYVTHMEINIRDNKKVKNHLFEWSIYPDSNVEIREFHEKVLSTSDCKTD